MSTTLTKPWSELTEREKALAFAEAFGVEACYLTLGHVMDIAERCDEIRLIKMHSGDWGVRIEMDGDRFETAISKSIADALAQALMKTIQ